jgi:hypothetical protein
MSTVTPNLYSILSDLEKYMEGANDLELPLLNDAHATLNRAVLASKRILAKSSTPPPTSSSADSSAASSIPPSRGREIKPIIHKQRSRSVIIREDGLKAPPGYTLCKGESEKVEGKLYERTSACAPRRGNVCKCHITCLGIHDGVEQLEIYTLPCL